jgi:leucyl aminopeptidase
MSHVLDVDFISLKDVKFAAKAAKTAPATTLVILAGVDGALGKATKTILGEAAAFVAKAATAAQFKGAAKSTMELLAPHGLSVDRLLVVGTHQAKKADPQAQDGLINLGGFIQGKLGRAAKVVVVFDPPEGEHSAADAADLMLGLKLRAYKFDTYKTKKKPDDEGAEPAKVQIEIAVTNPAEVRAQLPARQGLANGISLARDLVNEPANILYPVEFAKRAKQLEKLGVKVEILDVKAMQKLGMGALLGVGQGSVRESRMVVMHWNGAKAARGKAKSEAKPIAFIGKGVCFDTGGISIKPAGGMEDMKGDMAGAACVVGLMHALASRKAKVNVIGAIGLVENMPDGNAQRPGDIVKTMSGQTVEVINTDAEGRLVLADVLWYVQHKYQPGFMINLATLTGAILVALGKEYAGLFSNNDELSARLSAAGQATGEKVWRMPMGPAYDKMLDSQFADMKNIGGRNAGSITAAQFLQRFVNETPWAHLDIAGTGMGSPSSDINQSWGSGWGVRLLDKLVADHYEH